MVIVHFDLLVTDLTTHMSLRYVQDIINAAILTEYFNFHYQEDVGVKNVYSVTNNVCRQFSSTTSMKRDFLLTFGS